MYVMFKWLKIIGNAHQMSNLLTDNLRKTKREGTATLTNTQQKYTECSHTKS